MVFDALEGWDENWHLGFYGEQESVSFQNIVSEQMSMDTFVKHQFSSVLKFEYSLKADGQMGNFSKMTTHTEEPIGVMTLDMVQEMGYMWIYLDIYGSF